MAREAEGFTYNEDGEAIISEEEFMEIKKLKTLKQNYRMHHDDLKGLKSEIHYCQKQVDQSRQKLVKGEILPPICGTVAYGYIYNKVR